MTNFKLSRKRKKQYKKDLAKAYYKNLLTLVQKNKKDIKFLFGCILLLSVNKYEVERSEYRLHKSKEDWELFYFKRRVDVKCMEVILTYPEYDKEANKYEFDPKLAKPATNEQLFAYYKEHYPNDKLAHQFCQQNRHKYDNSRV